MQTGTNLVRAIGGEFISRKLRSVVLLAVLATVAVLIIEGWLITHSAWWWLLVIPMLICMAIGVVVFVIVMSIVRVIRPSLTKPQAAGVAAFVDKLERVADTMGMPVFMIFFQVVRDVVSPRQQTFIETVTKDSTTLHSDYARLRELFKLPQR